MYKVDLLQAKRKLSELVDRAGRGERIGITKEGKLVAVIRPAGDEVAFDEVFAKMDEIRKRTKKLPGVTVKDLIEEGRR